MAARSGISQGLLAAPVIIALGMDVTVTPLNAMLDVNPWFRWVYYGGFVGIGFVLFRSARVERDHEHRRSSSLKGLSGVFKAEEQGLWDQNNATPAGGALNIDAGAKVGGLTREGSELNIETEVDVETVHGMRIQPTDAVQRTVGATGSTSSMDRVLDAIGRFFRRGDDHAASREQRRREALTQRAEQDPLVASRPVAPIAFDSDTGAGSESFASVPQAPPPAPVHACAACGARHEPDDRFCPECGTALPLPIA
ncbi:MAG: zinc ribbon domain-containing protein [Candidatus Poseidoniaceae archaeon]|nr:zinc ribbon domain-containing protein [Candidatus Poseidoniaceae archaeon]